MSNGDTPEVKQTLDTVKENWDSISKMTAIRELAGAVAPPESQFSLNWQMLDQFGGNVQVTMRAAFIGEWPEIMGSRKDFCIKAQEAGWTFPGTVKPTAAAPAPIAPAAPAPVGAPAPANGNGVLTVKTMLLKVTPRANDGKVDLDFCNPGRQYPELRAVKSPEQAAVLLANVGAWTAAHFSKAETYPLAVSIEYVLGKTNSKGTQYKDIMKVSPV